MNDDLLPPGVPDTPEDILLYVYGQGDPLTYDQDLAEAEERERQAIQAFLDSVPAAA